MIELDKDLLAESIAQFTTDKYLQEQIMLLCISAYKADKYMESTGKFTQWTMAIPYSNVTVNIEQPGFITVWDTKSLDNKTIFIHGPDKIQCDIGSKE